MDRNDRWRPAPGGVSVSHPRVTAGTLSAFLWLDGKAYIVSNSHVIADGGQAEVGDSVLQPGSFDNGQDPDDAIGRLSLIVPYRLDTPNLVDLAIAEAIPEHVDDRILELRPGSDILEVVPGEPAVGDQVLKSGRTTGLTTGTVIAMAVTVSVAGFPGGSLIFEDCFMVEGAVRGGDSGSAVIAGDGRLLGLLFAGVEDEFYVACKASNILKALEATPGFRPALSAAAPQARWFLPGLLGGLMVANSLYFASRQRY